MTIQPKCPFTYSNLVNVYWAEGIRALDMGCYFSAIAVLWASIDYAIEHQLWGGNVLDAKTLKNVREPIPFDARQMKVKVKSLFHLYPALAGEWEGRLPALYDRFRNTFLHAKLENVTVHEIGAGQIIDLKAGKSMRQDERSAAEVNLIGAASAAANLMRFEAERFLTDLNAQVNPRS